MLINAVHANTATSREMLLVQRKQLKMLKALNKETKQVNTITASRSTPGTKNTELTKEQVIDSHITSDILHVSTIDLQEHDALHAIWS